MIRFSDIQDAFFFVSAAGYGRHSAVLCKDTGKIFYRSEMGDIDEIDDEASEGEESKNLVHPADASAYCMHHPATGRTHLNID